MNASNSSSEWKCAICPETTCSTRPSQANGAPGGWARNCTTNARLVGSGSGGSRHRRPPATPPPGGAVSRCSWHARKIQYARRLRPEPKRSNWGGEARGAFQNCSSCSGGRHDGTRAPDHLWPFPAGDDAGSLVAGRPGDPLSTPQPSLHCISAPRFPPGLVLRWPQAVTGDVTLM